MASQPTAANVIENAVGDVGETKTKIGKLKKILKFLGNFLDKHTIVITNLILTALTYGGEELLEFTFFKCPSSQPAAYKYALAYTLGVAITLLLFGIAVYNVTWKIFHGCACFSNFCKICCGEKGERNCCSGCGDACSHPISKQCYLMSFGVLVKTSVAPFAWCLICLWDGDYMACGFSETPGEQNSTDYLEWKAESQFYGYIALPCFMGAMILCHAIYRCCIERSYMLHRYISVYKESEENELRDKMSVSAGKLSQHVVTSFLNRKDLKTVDWNEVSLFGTETAKKEEVYYSPLHKCVLENGWLKLDRSVQTITDETPAVNTQLPSTEPSNVPPKPPVSPKPVVLPNNA